MSKEKKVKPAPAPEVDNFTAVWGGPEERVRRACDGCGFVCVALENQGRFYCGPCWVNGSPVSPSAAQRLPTGDEAHA